MFCIVKSIKTNIIIYQHNDYNDDVISIVRNKILNNKFHDGLTDIGYQRSYKDDNYSYYYLLKGIRNNKSGRYKAKAIHSGIVELLNAYNRKDSIDNTIKEISLHNTRNIHESILICLKKAFVHNELIKSNDKVLFIKDILISDPNPISISKDIWASFKSLEQVAFDYDIIDYIGQAKKFSKSYFTRNRIHTLFILVFYLYEYDFRKKGIELDINTSYDYINVNFNTFRSSIYLIFQNCLKYTKSNSKITIEKDSSSDYYKLIIKMVSIENLDSEIEDLFLPKYRGENAKKNFPDNGKGIGFYAARALLELNNIEIKFIKMLNTTILEKKIKYCKNEIHLLIPISQIKFCDNYEENH